MGSEMCIRDRESGLVSSGGEALRMLKQGAVRLDGERVSDRGVCIGKGETVLVQVGKRRIARVEVGG